MFVRFNKLTLEIDSTLYVVTSKNKHSESITEGQYAYNTEPPLTVTMIGRHETILNSIVYHGCCKLISPYLFKININC